MKEFSLRLSRVLMLIGGIVVYMGSCSKNESRLDLSVSDKYENKPVELISYTDSTVVATATIADGKASFILPDTLPSPMLLQVTIDGRRRAYYVVEPGHAVMNDSLRVVNGTPLNDKFAVLMQKLDSIENLDDTDAYVAFVAEQYNANKDNGVGIYFGGEWLRKSPTARIDSILTSAPDVLKNSSVAAKYRKMASLRDATAPGRKFTDFEAEQPNGKNVKFSSYLDGKKYVLVDFWASWCPYCIKDLPALKEIYSKYGDQLEIVGVAVRDMPDDTRSAVEKHQIPWKVMYNTQRVPYDIYGFTGIPHLMLLAPDGTIVSRGEGPKKIAERMAEIASGANK